MMGALRAQDAVQNFSLWPCKKGEQVTHRVGNWALLDTIEVVDPLTLGSHLPTHMHVLPVALNGSTGSRSTIVSPRVQNR